MNVLVACEESQRVCTAFRAKGHNAFKDTFGYGLTAKVILSFYEKEG